MNYPGDPSLTLRLSTVRDGPARRPEFITLTASHPDHRGGWYLRGADDRTYHVAAVDLPTDRPTPGALYSVRRVSAVLQLPL